MPQNASEECFRNEGAAFGADLAAGAQQPEVLLEHAELLAQGLRAEDRRQTEPDRLRAGLNGQPPGEHPWRLRRRHTPVAKRGTVCGGCDALPVAVDPGRIPGPGRRIGSEASTMLVVEAVYRGPEVGVECRFERS